MFNTFLLLFDFAGDILGRLVGFATLTVGELLHVTNFTRGYINVPYINIFTGVDTFFYIRFNNLMGVVIYPLLGIMFLGVPSSFPVWQALVMQSAGIFILIAGVKFLKGVF